MQEHGSIPAGPMLVIYPIPLKNWVKKKKWEYESSDVFFIPCLFQSLSLMGLSFCLVVSEIGLSMYVFISLLFVSLECKVYKDRYFCQHFLPYIPRVKDSGEPMVGTCYILDLGIGPT